MDSQVKSDEQKLKELAGRILIMAGYAHRIREYQGHVEAGSTEGMDEQTWVRTHARKIEQIADICDEIHGMDVGEFLDEFRAARLEDFRDLKFDFTKETYHADS